MRKRHCPSSMRRIWEEMKSRPVEYAVDWDRMYQQVSRRTRGFRDGGSRADLAGAGVWRAAAAIFLGLGGAGGLLVGGLPAAGGGRGRGALVAVVKKDSAGRVGEYVLGDRGKQKSYSSAGWEHGHPE